VKVPVLQGMMGLLKVPYDWREGTRQVKRIAVGSQVKVSTDGHGVVSLAEMRMLRELADLTGLSPQVRGGPTPDLAGKAGKWTCEHPVLVFRLFNAGDPIRQTATNPS
jgi:hypothetical protein